MAQNTFSLEVTNDHAVPVQPGGGTATVLNVSGDTLFYADNPQVSSVSNQGSLTAGNAATFTSSQWVRSASLSTVQVTIVPSSGSGITSGDVSVVGGVSTVGTVGGVSASAVSGASYPQGNWRPTITLIPLPALVQNTTTGPNNGPSLTTANGFEYAMWVSTAGHPVIGQRPLSSGPLADGEGFWTFTDLSATALGTQVADVHNYYAVAVDGNGFIHIAGNMHTAALKYVKSNSPNSIAAFSTGTMTGVHESGISYPQFITLSNGNLLFQYRDEANNGTCNIKTYTTSAGTWADNPGIVISATAGEGSYTHALAVSQDGTRWGLANCWRGTNPYTNLDMCFSESRDGGATWWNAAHTTQLTPPITHAASAIAESIPTNGSGLLNAVNMSTAYDSNGRPHICYLMNDATGATNVRHTYWDGAAWQHEFVTFGTYQMSLNPPFVSGQAVVDQSVARPGVFADANGGVYILWRTHHEGKRGSLRLIDISTPGVPVESAIYLGDLGYMEPQNFDQVAMKAGKLRTLIVPSPYAITGFGDYGDALNWGAQWGAILTVDVKHLRAHIGNVGRRSGVNPLAEAHMAQGSTVTATTTSLVDLAGAPQIVIDPYSADDGQILIARLIAQASKATGGSGTFAIVQKDHIGANATAIGSLTFPKTSGQYVQRTPWVPLQLGAMPLGGVLTIQGKCSDVNVVTAQALTLQLGALEQPGGGPILTNSAQPNVPAENAFVTGVTTGTLFADWDASQQGGTNGAALQMLLDRSGNGLHMTQFGSTPMPNLTTAALNGLNVYAFTGTQLAYMANGPDVMGGGIQTLFPSPLWTVFLVVNLTTNATAGPIISADDSNPNGLGGATSSARVCQVQGSGAGNATAIGFNTAGANGSANQAITTAAWHMVTAQRTAAGVQVWVDGTSTSGNVAITGTPTTISQIAPITLGGRVSTPGGLTLQAAPWLNGSLARAVVFSGALNSTDRAAVESGLRTVYAF